MIRYRVDGGQRLQQKLDELSSRVSRGLQKEALAAAAAPIRSSIASLAPREPGAPDLAENIVITLGRARGTQTSASIGPERSFFYGFYQEYGTVRHRAQPFMRPAFDSLVKAGKTIQIVTNVLWRGIASVVGGSRGQQQGGGLL